MNRMYCNPSVDTALKLTKISKTKDTMILNCQATCGTLRWEQKYDGECAIHAMNFVFFNRFQVPVIKKH